MRTEREIEKDERESIPFLSPRQDDSIQSLEEVRNHVNTCTGPHLRYG
jgi:hypothetical protein